MPWMRHSVPAQLTWLHIQLVCSPSLKHCHSSPPCSPAGWLLKTQNGMRRCCRLFNPRGWICYDVAPAAPSG